MFLIANCRWRCYLSIGGNFRKLSVRYPVDFWFQNAVQLTHNVLTGSLALLLLLTRTPWQLVAAERMRGRGGELKSNSNTQQQTRGENAALMTFFFSSFLSTHWFTDYWFCILLLTVKYWTTFLCSIVFFLAIFFITTVRRVSKPRAKWATCRLGPLSVCAFYCLICLSYFVCSFTHAFVCCFVAVSPYRSVDF